VIGSLSIAELCRSGVSPKVMRRYMADFQARGIVEPAGADSWRLTKSAIEKYGFAFRAIQAGNVPLEAGDDDGLDHCKPGPSKAAA
jgi:hypothetical protein